MAFRFIPLGVKLAGVSAAAIMLQACGTLQKSQSAAGIGDDQYRGAIGVYSNHAVDEGMDPIAAAAFWGTRYNVDQSDPAVAVRFSKALRKIGSTEESVSVMQQASSTHPENVEVSLEYGKVLVEAGRAFEAVRHLENAVATSPADWTAVSAYGVALDQIGEHDQARRQYNRALALNPAAVSVLSNKGLSYALDGNLSMARTTLREAASSAGGDARIRQNLALVLALSGEMAEAERLARSDLPPQVADNNIGVFRQLMNQPAYWGEYAATDTDVPSFDAAPLSPTQKPQLQETPKPKEDESKGAPLSLLEPTAVTNASATIETDGVDTDEIETESIGDLDQ